MAKKSATKKKPVKKVSKGQQTKNKKSNKKPETGIAVIQQADLHSPEKSAGKYMLQKSWVGEKQLLKMLQRTPANHVFKRPGKGGIEFDYVTGTYIKKILNYVFGWNWDFQIINIIKEDRQVIMHGRLTVRDASGKHTIIKEQFGRADIKFMKDTNKPLDLGNDYKAASTDALKKCAAEFGIASDIYGKNEFQDLGARVVTPDEQQPNNDEVPTIQLDPIVVKPVAHNHGLGLKGKCDGCGVKVDPVVERYSQKMYKGKTFCRKCQTAKNKK